MMMMIIIMIIIIQGISIEHNLQLIARAQCAYSKMQIYAYIKTEEKKKKKEEGKRNKHGTPEYLNYHTMDNKN